jgi:hypothetical protein
VEVEATAAVEVTLVSRVRKIRWCRHLFSMIGGGGYGGQQGGGYGGQQGGGGYGGGGYGGQGNIGRIYTSSMLTDIFA